MLQLKEMLIDSPYIAYSYSYPHKTAYRRLENKISLAKLWQEERLDSLFLYLHVPFCEMRCGFCNLFTTPNPKTDFESEYLAALERQASQIAKHFSLATFTRLAIGGGTPTYLSTKNLEQLLNIPSKYFKINIANTPTSIETSPFTATEEKLELLSEWGISRVSIGVQSFIENEVNAVGRSQKTSTVVLALENIRKFKFATLNIDLIYGLPGQTLESWCESLKIALSFEPEELYLYPLYIRPLTGLGRQSKAWNDERVKFYRAGRDLLLEAGYKQHSMRMFQANKTTIDSKQNGLAYCCQTDGMVGLGAGARSYTSNLHYSTEYAVSNEGTKEILANYIVKNDLDFTFADYGFLLDTTEQKHRYIIQSLLQVDGLNLSVYQNHFASQALSDLPSLKELLDLELAYLRENMMYLTDSGLEKSDIIGYWLYSNKVINLMSDYKLR